VHPLASPAAVFEHEATVRFKLAAWVARPTAAPHDGVHIIIETQAACAMAEVNPSAQTRPFWYPPWSEKATAPNDGFADVGTRLKV
jgi:hypothetical protein